jgi:hypothetical protein
MQVIENMEAKHFKWAVIAVLGSVTAREAGAIFFSGN